VLFVVGHAAPARADWVLTPFLGLSFGGDTVDRHVTYGGSLTFMGGGVFGFEIDGSVTPNFFDTDDALDLTIGDTSVGTLMANVIIGAPLGEPGIRPYVSGGAGVLRVNIDSPVDVLDVRDDALGVNVGAGIMGFVSSRVALRADIRYFRRFQEDDSNDEFDLDFGSFNFWRGTLGLSLRF
jgi:opacity protein-like surface antigen